MKKTILFFGACAIVLCLSVSACAAEALPYAMLQVLDKVTTQRHLIYVPAGKSVTVGTLNIASRVCYASNPDEKPEASAFVEIYDAKGAGGATKAIFSGWMFRSSPSLSGLEHPIYDVVVLGCSNSVNTKS